MALTDALRDLTETATATAAALEQLAAQDGRTVRVTIEPSLTPGAMDRAMNDALRRDALSKSLPLLKRKVG